MQANPHLPTFATLAAALAASLTLVACQPGHDARNSVAPNPAEGAKALADKAIDVAGNAAMTIAVNTALAKDETLSVWRIDVHVVDGHVVLDGDAPDANSRQRATLLAQGVPGVKSVDNRLSLAPTT